MSPPGLYRQRALEQQARKADHGEALTLVGPGARLAAALSLGISVAGVVLACLISIPISVAGRGILLERGGLQGLFAGADGHVLNLRVAPGSVVRAGERIAQVVIAGSGGKPPVNVDIVAPRDAIVAGLRVGEGDVVTAQSEIATLIPEHGGRTERLVAYLFVPGESGTLVRRGMAVQVVPASLSPEEYGYIRGSVAQVSQLPVDSDELEELLRNRDLVQQIMHEGVPIQLEVDLQSGPTVSGYRWTSSQGPSIALGHGTQLIGRVELRRERLIAVVLPFLKRFFP